MSLENRTGFEALGRSEGWNMTTIMLTSCPPQFGRYADGCTQAAYEAWQAGRRDIYAQLRDLEMAANTAAHCYAHRPENFAAALTALDTEAERVRELLNEVKA